MKEMYKGMVNSPQTKLSKAINSADTDIYVKDGSAFPKGPNLAVIGTDKSAETILYSSVNNDILVGCTRGYQGTARNWDANTPIARNFTEADLDAVQENIRTLDEKTLADMTDDATHRTVSDTEKTTWNNKVDKVDGKALSTNDFTDAAKKKVEAIPLNPKYTDTIQDLSGYLKKSEVFDGKTFNGDQAKLKNIPFSANQGVNLWWMLDRIAPYGKLDLSRAAPKISIPDREPIWSNELQGILLNGALNELFLRTTKLNEKKADKQYLYDILMGESLVTRKAGEWPEVHGEPTSIEAGTFRDKGLTSVTIPPSVTIIEASAFENNELTSVTIPLGVRIIGQDAFCTNELTNVVIPRSVERIDYNAFYNNELTEVKVPKNCAVSDAAFDAGVNIIRY